jgi:SNF2 family DNA or RNA helicase
MYRSPNHMLSPLETPLTKVLTKASHVKDFIESSAAQSSCLVLSYESFRRHADLLNSCDQIDLLVTDEGHRLKSADGNKTIAALNGGSTGRALSRLLITGTPVQNDLEEFYGVVSFVNPGALGSIEDYRRQYAR